MRTLRPRRTAEKRSLSRTLATRARLAREKDLRDGRHDRANEGWSVARSLARSSHIASPRLVSFAHRRSLRRLAPGIPRGCVTHSTRASIARGCRRWRLFLFLSLSFPFLYVSPFLSSPPSAPCCPVAIAPIIGRHRESLSLSPRIEEIGPSRVGRVRRNEHAAGRATLLFLGVVYFLGTTLASRVASLARLGSARREEP